VLDDLERARTAAGQTSDSEQLVLGIELVRRTFLEALRRHGVAPVPALGQPFDPNYHHARAAKAVSGAALNTVVEVVKEGYRLHDRLLRPAEVVVAIPSN
jgi:molecular chaperone GrpE